MEMKTQGTAPERGRLHPGARRSPLRLSLLHGFELRRGEQIVSLPPSAQRLLAFVALHEHPVRRIYVAGQLWTNASQEHANASLRTTLWRLRRPACTVVEGGEGEIGLGTHVEVDVHDVALRAQRVLEHRVEQGDLLRLSRAGDLLPDWYDDWLVVERERLRQLRLQALETLCEDLMAHGHLAAAMEAGLAAVAAEPLRESAHRVVIEVHLRQGNLAEALRQYHLYRHLLHEELQLVPSSAMRSLVESILSPGDEPGPVR
jgi:DNA-binding SARP family transcriptional activator